MPSEDQLSLLPGESLPKKPGKDAQMKFSAFDEAAMRRALELAERGLYSTHPNPRVGAVLARDEEIVGEGWHERAGEPHAEPIAIRAAGERARGATAYVTLEPCSHHGRTPPCVDVLLAAGVRRVVYAVGDPNPRVNGAGAAAPAGKRASRWSPGCWPPTRRRSTPDSSCACATAGRSCA